MAAGDRILKNTRQDKDILLNVNVGGVQKSLLRLGAANSSLDFLDQSGQTYFSRLRFSNTSMTADRNLTIDMGNVARDVILQGQLTVSGDSSINQALLTTSLPSFGAITLTNDLASITMKDQAYTSFNGIIKFASSVALSAHRTLTLDLANVSNTVKIAGGLTVEAASIVNQDLTSDADVTFNSTNLVTGQSYKINSVGVLSSTALGSSVVSSSLTSVGTLSSLDVSGSGGTALDGEAHVVTSSRYPLTVQSTQTSGANNIVEFFASGADTSGDEMWDLQFVGKDSATNNTIYSSIKADLVTNTDTAESGKLSFWVKTAGAALEEVVQIKGGSVGIGVDPTTFAANLDVSKDNTSFLMRLRNTNAGAAHAGLQIDYSGVDNNSSTTNKFLECKAAGNDKLIAYGNGDVKNQNGVYGTISDVSLKENIVDATAKLADILLLQVRHYNLKTDDISKKQIGFIAQEMETVFPGLVEADDSGMKAIKTSVLIPMLVKAIQELTARVVALETPA